MDLIEDIDGSKSLGTMSTDGKSIYYYPPFVESLSVPELEFVLAHESGVHKGLLHHIRLREMGPGIDFATFNQAADYVGNSILMNAGIGKPPKDGWYDDRFTDKNVEQTYHILMKEKQDQQKQPQNSQNQQGLSPDLSSGQGIPQPQPQIGDDPGKCGGVIPAPETQESDIREAKEDAKSEVRKALQTAKKAGHIPEGLRKLIEEILEPKIDWRSLLRQFVEERSQNDYSWTRPNKRFLPQGMYMPQLDSRELGRVVLLIDRSGSISNEQAQALLSEGISILESYPNTTLQVIFFATRASDPIELTEVNQIKQIQQTDVGSGTNYIPPFTKINEKGIDPTIIIVLTDGYCHSFPKYVDAPVIWLINNRDQFQPPFGEVIRMEE
jgi:predicted metal-dependent peptidase